MKPMLTILTCSAAVIGMIAVTQITTGVGGGERIHASQDSPSERTTGRASGDEGQRRRVDSRGGFQRDGVRHPLAIDNQQPITPELIDQALAVAHEIDPEMGDQLKSMCGNDPEAFERVLRTTGRRLIGMAELRTRAPELYDMKRREWQQEVLIARTVRELAEAREEGDSLRVRALENQLRSHISIQVAMQIAVRGDYLRRLKEQIAALEREIDQQARRFEQTVEERFQAVVNQMDERTREDEIDYIDFDD